ncbi:MAG: hypothetical protein DRI65_06130 [Chloroflexota bacterium]|nr:MAG: hypothetical protein DRI65_06130 [Chloroflexota bacterium]
MGKQSNSWAQSLIGDPIASLENSDRLKQFREARREDPATKKFGKTRHRTDKYLRARKDLEEIFDQTA